MAAVGFSFYFNSPKSAAEGLLLARSIRTFGGNFKNNPVFAWYPDRLALSEELLELYKNETVVLKSLQLDEQILLFPFAGKVIASAEAEKKAASEGLILAWMDRDSLVINPPEIFQLPDDKSLAYRPVDHRLIGSLFDSPLSPLWEKVYKICDVDPDEVYACFTSVDHEKLRFYVNAGMLILRPESLLGTWKETFLKWYRDDFFKTYYQENQLYAIFIHQVFLAALILKQYPQDQLLELPPLVNYPVHMHLKNKSEDKPKVMNEIITLRHDTFFQETNWPDAIEIKEPLKSWIHNQVGKILTNY